MMFHAATGRMVLPADAVKRAAGNMLWSLKKIREAAGLPLDRYERHGPLEASDFAQMAVIEAAEALGIDLGVGRHDFHKLDLREVG